jgi:Mg-chelatase subunit ChlD
MASGSKEAELSDAERAPAPMAAPPAPPAPPRAAAGPHGGAPAPTSAAAKPKKAASAGAARADVAGVAAESQGVRAGEWDDNANYREFQRYLGAESRLGIHGVDVRNRRFLVVRDADGKAVPRCPVTIRDDRQHEVRLTTTASGRAILFPNAEGLTGKDLTAEARCQNGSASARFPLQQSDGIVDLKLAARRALPTSREVDVAFVLDTTGSMSEEISAVKSTIQKVASSLSVDGVRVRIGLVEFKDRTDPFVTKVYPMTNDVQRFAAQVSRIEASGGGDTPESVNEGLHVALTQLDWADRSVAKLAFLIGDAPPHLDYENDADYARDMRDAAHRGVQVFTIAASGMDDLGQAVWRQIAHYTGATNLFVLRGGAGPQSTGAGDPKSSCGGTQTAYRSGNLDVLVLQKIRREISALDRDPMRIAGVFGDENAKPCAQRVAVAE